MRQAHHTIEHAYWQAVRVIQPWGSPGEGRYYHGKITAASEEKESQTPFTVILSFHESTGYTVCTEQPDVFVGDVYRW